MMRKTQSLQVSLDWEDEADLVRLARAAHAIAGPLAALTAASPIEEGHVTGFASRRLGIWEETDPTRTGFSPVSSYEDYVRWALGVPLVFERVGTRHFTAPPWTFGELLAR